MERKVTQHPAYGLVQINRVSGYEYLVGSEVAHQDYFELRIREAERIEEDGGWRFFGKRKLIEIKLTANQMIDLFTQMNIGEGIPCTIGEVDNVARPRVSREKSRIELMSEHGMEKVEERVRESKDVLEKVLELCSTLPQKKKDAIKSIMTVFINNTHLNAGWYINRISEATEQAISIAKTEVESHVAATVRALGLKSLRELDRVALTAKEEE